MTIVFWVTLVVLVLVIASLVSGVVSMARGGHFDEAHSEHFMFSRVAFQAAVVVLLMQLAYMNYV